MNNNTIIIVVIIIINHHNNNNNKYMVLRRIKLHIKRTLTINNSLLTSS